MKHEALKFNSMFCHPGVYNYWRKKSQQMSKETERIIHVFDTQLSEQWKFKNECEHNKNDNDHEK